MKIFAIALLVTAMAVPANAGVVWTRGKVKSLYR
jgi:hypothetical protein